MRKTVQPTLLLASALLFLTVNSQAQDSSRIQAAKPQAKTTVQPAVKPTVKPKNSAPSVKAQTPSAAQKVRTSEPSAAAATTAPVSLNAQYNELLKKSWSQQGYKVINVQRLNALWRNVQDSLRKEKVRAAKVQKQLGTQNERIQNLQAEASESRADLKESQASVNQISFLGMSVDRSTYSTVMWVLVLALALALATVIFTAGRSVREARYRRQLYDELASEYQTYKVKANDKEKKLARELQTERNRIEELLNRG